MPRSPRSGRPPGVSLAIIPPLTSSTVLRPVNPPMPDTSDRNIPRLAAACPSVGWCPTNSMISCFRPIGDTPFGAIGDLMLVPDPATRDQRTLVTHRLRLVRMRTMIKNGLHAIALNRRLGVNHIVASVHWVGMPNSLALEQFEILAKEVMPKVRQAI